MTAYMDKLIGQLVAKLEALALRDNTLLLFIGDNGTSGKITSRFKGADLKGGKGSTTHRGTHVPCIVNWPAMIKSGHVSQDLISSTDFLPTLCAAAGANVPSTMDGISFLPQLKGEAGTPRSWLYTWYSPRQKANLEIKECVFDTRYKLYRTGEFYDLRVDADEKRPLSTTELQGDAAAAHTRLQSALERFKDARPVELDRQFEASFSSLKSAKKKRQAP
jgi:arylsulfatase A